MKKLASRVSVELNRHALIILRCALACVLVASVSLWGLAFADPSSAQAQQSQESQQSQQMQQSQQYSHSINALQSALGDKSCEQTNLPVVYADGDSGTSSNDTVGISLYYENPDDPDKPYACSSTAHPPRIYEPLGSMQLYAEVETVSGAIDWAGTLGVGVVWNIEHTYDENGVEIDSDPGIATIDRGSGELRALGQGNGSVVVRCTAQSPYEGSAEASISIEANTGVPYVTDIRICDENGNPYEDDAEIRVESDYFGLEKSFFAAVTYCDPLTGDITRKSTYDGDEIPGLKWSVSGDNKTAYVNEDTGVFIAQDTGSVKLTAYISGAGILGDTVDDYVFVLCGGDTLDASRNYVPADYLTVVVKYAKEDKDDYLSREDYDTARTWYYTDEDLAALGTVTNSYTLIKNDGNWSRMDAYGIYFANLLSDQGLTIDEIEGFYFGATDEYNMGFVGCSWLFETPRYYFPNLSIGNGLTDARQVAPMIGLATYEETLGDGLVDINPDELSTQTRFRLCLGAENTTVNNAQQSIYNVFQITVILEGAPPVGWGDPNNGSGTQPTVTEPNPQPEPDPDPDPNPDEPDPTPEPDPEPTPAPDTGSNNPDNDNPDAVPLPSTGDGGGTDSGGGNESGTSGTTANPSTSEGTTGGSVGNINNDMSVNNDRSSSSARPSVGNPRDMDTPLVENSVSPVEVRSSASDSVSPTETSSPVGMTQPAQEQSADEAAAEDAAGESANSPQESLEPEASSNPWAMYEMMRNDDAPIAALDVDNPLVPWAIVCTILAFVLGGGLAIVRYRRDLSPTSLRFANAG